MPKEKWFFTNSAALVIWTYGSGDTPAGKFVFDSTDDFETKKAELIKDGFKFIKDQA